MTTTPLVAALADPAERLLARSILDTDDPAAIRARVDAHCRSVLGAGVAEIDFAEISTGAAFGLVLTDGRRVFLKAWTPATPLALLRDAHEVQSFLAARGFPAPACSWVRGPSEPAMRRSTNTGARAASRMRARPRFAPPWRRRWPG
jgi:hypothetical protein